jgi:RNA polymerase sigma factor (sigma-70 family)
MGVGPLSSFIRRLRGDLAASQRGGVSDAQLLDRWLVQRDEAAFEVLLWRHGPMILGVCRRVLHNDADVEDAFQATFLLLMRKAASIRRGASVAAWLYQTAYRVALRARQRSREQSARESARGELPATDPNEEILWRDVRPLLDEEINRLPEKYRVPFIRCYLEGCTNEEAAVEMGCPVGTIHSRLSWARERLRSRLARRGLTLATAGLTALLVQNAASAALPTPLAETTLQAAFAYAAQSTAGVSAGAVALTKGVLRTMFIAKLKLGVAVVLAVLLAGGVSGLACYRVAEAAAYPPRATPATSGPLPAPAPAAEAPATRTIKVPSQVDGVLLGVFTEIKPNEKIADKDVIVVGTHKYRRLREGDEVVEGQLLARVDDTTAATDLTVAQAKLEAANADLVVSTKTRDEAKNRYDEIIATNMKTPGTFSPGEIRGAKLTWERYVQDEATKKANVVVAEAELKRAKVTLDRYTVRSPVRGVVKTIHVQKGEAVKHLEPVLEILPAEEK